MTDLRTVINKRDAFFTIAIVLLPFLYQYKGIGNIVSFGEVVVTFSMAIILLFDKVSFKRINVSLLLFYVVTILMLVINSMEDYFSFSAASTLLMRMLFYAVVLFLARDHFSIEYAFKLYTFLVLFFSIYLICQYIVFLGTGSYLPIYIKDSWQFAPEARASDLSEYYKFAFRPSSLFAEPSYFALYTIPLVCMLAFKTRRSFLESTTLIIAILALFLSTSSSGIAAVFIIFAVFFFKSQRKKTVSLFLIKVLIVLIGAVGLYYFLQLETAMWTLERFSTGGSVNQRITRGIIVYRQLPFFHQLFGLGLNNLESYMVANNITTIYDEGDLNYCASLIQTLNYSGIVGFSFLLLFLYTHFTKCRRIIRNNRRPPHVFDSNALISLYLVIVFILLYESILFSYRFAYLFIYLEALQRLYVKEGISAKAFITTTT